MWIAVGLMLMLEGLLPFSRPRQWRQMFLRIASMSDGQIRFSGMLSILAGLGIFWLCAA
jgi:uncharacterized protein